MAPLCKGSWMREAQTEGLSGLYSIGMSYNPSASLTLDTSLYTREAGVTRFSQTFRYQKKIRSPSDLIFPPFVRLLP